MSKQIFNNTPIKREGKDFYDNANVRYEAKNKEEFKALATVLGEKISDEALDAFFPVEETLAPARNTEIQYVEKEVVVEKERIIDSYMAAETAINDVMAYLETVPCSEELRAAITSAKFLINEANQI